MRLKRVLALRSASITCRYDARFVSITEAPNIEGCLRRDDWSGRANRGSVKIDLSSMHQPHAFTLAMFAAASSESQMPILPSDQLLG